MRLFNIASEELLKATIKHVNEEHIEAFYKTANDRFVIVLNSIDLKGFYSHEINFREQVQNMTLTFHILPRYQSKKFQDRQDTRGTRQDSNTIFVTMYLPSTILNTAVEKAFMAFGNVHTVFAGRFKDDLKGIRNGKRHIRLTPHKSKHDLPHVIQFPEDDRFFKVMWAEKIIFCKNCLSHHMLKDDCKSIQRNPVYQEDGVTFDTRPCYPDKGTDDPEDNTSNAKVTVKAMDPGYPEAREKTPISDLFSNKQANANTQNKVSDTLVASSFEKSNHDTGSGTTVPVVWGDDHVEMPSDTGTCSSALQKKVTCVDSPNRDNAASLIPTDVSGTAPGCNDALGLPNKEDPSTFSNSEIHASSPVSKSNESSNAAATVMATIKDKIKIFAS